MLIRASNNDFLFNLDTISHIYRDGDMLYCVVPSANSESGYDNIALISGNATKTYYHIRRICYMYSQYVVNENGDMFIPPKVYTINTDDSYVIKANQISATVIWDSARITMDNKASIGFILTVRGTGRVLVENQDYTVTLPYFRGQAEQHRFVFHILSSNTYLTWGVTYTNGWKSFMEDIKMPTINVTSNE